MKNLFVILLGLIVFSGCQNKQVAEMEKAQLQSQIDSLAQIAEANTYHMGLLEQVNMYMDSIDAQRNWIKVELEEGMEGEDFINRMKSLNTYVQKAEFTISELEKSRSAFAAQVKRLKRDLEAKNVEIQALKDKVEYLTNENVALTDKITIREAELVQAELSLESRKQELQVLESKIDAMLKAAKVSEADGYFARGESMEEIANRTQLAPRRKKEALQQALELYLKANEAGHEGAAAKIQGLKNKLKVDE
ncbi:MAG: hypothetical protein OEY56_06735 [Cyclobacteriaceae bacterium]|nr:hypothetical protein [Cyclobacteriaceae bacterium]